MDVVYFWTAGSVIELRSRFVVFRWGYYYPLAFPKCMNIRSRIRILLEPQQYARQGFLSQTPKSSYSGKEKVYFEHNLTPIALSTDTRNLTAGLSHGLAFCANSRYPGSLSAKPRLQRHMGLKSQRGEVGRRGETRTRNSVNYVPSEKPCLEIVDRRMWHRNLKTGHGINLYTEPAG